ncbi:hypothetical protein RRG08_063416 [Elysia crispata]|uniref:Uncharacterized protein n=1 Tax=Elysia crispata TaxID=231223 RepID=A0AAE1A9F1_9GAST|nr:hypothetical protein RRG08_063416 [Elysia crispata]
MVVDSFIDSAHRYRSHHSDFIADREAVLHSTDSQSRHGSGQLHRLSPPTEKQFSILLTANQDMVVDSFIDPAHHYRSHHSDFIADREAVLHSTDSQSRHGSGQLHRLSPPTEKQFSILLTANQDMVVDSFIDSAHHYRSHHSDFIADREAVLHSTDSQSRHGSGQLHRPSPPVSVTPL